MLPKFFFVTYLHVQPIRYDYKYLPIEDIMQNAQEVYNLEMAK